MAKIFNYEIRKANIADVKDLGKLYYQFWQFHFKFDPLIKPTKKFNLQVATKDAAKDIRKRNKTILVAVENKKILGFIEYEINTNDPFFKVRKYGYINAALVAKEARGQGIAKKLFQTAEKYFKTEKLQYIKTSVYIKNEVAIKTWTNFGFKPTSTFFIKKINK